jgi:hypothetical protein
VEDPESDVLNSAVLGASLYDDDGFKDSENLTITLTFKHLLSGERFNISGNFVYILRDHSLRLKP